MKYLLILLSFSFQYCYSQITADSLRKYSYPLIGIYPGFGCGTGFFIKANGRLFLVTAKHVIIGCNGKGERIPNYPNMMFLGLYGSQDKSFTIDVKEPQRTLSCDGVDIFVQEISNQFLPYYNSVEQFIMPNIVEYKTIEMYGYPITTFDSTVLTIPEKSQHLTIPEQTFDFTNGIDSTWKIDTLITQITYPKSVHVVGGFSGAPLFLQDKRNNKWRIIGMLISGSPVIGDSRATLRYVDIKYAINAVNKLLFQ